MKVTFLGTGTSQGVPVIACSCKVCLSSDAFDRRLRTSLLIQSDSTTLLIDSGPDFRQQMLKAGVKKLDAIVYTHSHKDHLAGLDDVRAFNHIQKDAIDIFADSFTQEAIRQEFSYIFQRPDYPGIPRIRLNSINKNSLFTIGDIQLQAIEVMHFKMPVLGFRCMDFTYITDANFISEDEKTKIKGSRILVLNALRKEKHVSHFTLSEAIEIATEMGADATYLTHISHQLGPHHEITKELPEGINLAYDMLSLEI